LNTEIK